MSGLHLAMWEVHLLPWTRKESSADCRIKRDNLEYWTCWYQSECNTVLSKLAINRHHPPKETSTPGH